MFLFSAQKGMFCPLWWPNPCLHQKYHWVSKGFWHLHQQCSHCEACLPPRRGKEKKYLFPCATNPFVHILKIHFQVRPTHNKGLKREISAGYKQMTDEVKGERGRDNDPLVCWCSMRHLKTSSSACTIDSLCESIKPLDSILFEAGIATWFTAPRGKSIREKEQCPHTPCSHTSCHHCEVPLLQTEGQF